VIGAAPRLSPMALAVTLRAARVSAGESGARRLRSTQRASVEPGRRLYRNV